MSLFALALAAATFDCTLTYLTTQEDGGTQAETRSGVFAPAGETPYLELSFADHSRRNATLALAPDGGIALQIGDFCGERFFSTELPADPGPAIRGTFSYGRDPGTNAWVTLSLGCAAKP